MAEGSHLVFDIKGGGHFSGYVIKLVQGVVMVHVQGEVPAAGTEISLRPSRELGAGNKKGIVAVTLGQSIAIRFESAEKPVEDGPTKRLETERTPIMWVADDKHVTIQMLETSRDGFNFEADVVLPQNSELTFQIALHGQFHSVRGKVVSCELGPKGHYVGTIQVIGSSRLDQSDWSACRRAS